MKYMLLCYDDEKAWEKAGEAELQAAMQEAVGLTHELDAKGQYLSAAPLHSVSTATSVRIREGKRIVTDGPFAETREQLGGYYLIDVPNLDEAIAIAARHRCRCVCEDDSLDARAACLPAARHGR